MGDVESKTDDAQQSNIQPFIKCVVVGDGCVGKSSLLSSYVSGTLTDSILPTIFDYFSKEVHYNNKALNLTLWDTAGLEDYDRQRPLLYPQTDVFIICFSVVSPTSFENISSKWFPEVRYFGPRTPILLVGTKSDLRECASTIRQLTASKQTPVTTEQGKILASKIKAVKYLECSALKQEGIQEVFDEVVKIVVTPTKQKRKSRSRQCVLL